MVENPTTLLRKTVHILAYRGKAKDKIGEVIDVRDTRVRPIKYKTYRDNKMLRSRFIITVYYVKQEEFRSYYHEYVSMEELSPTKRWWQFWRA